MRPIKKKIPLTSKTSKDWRYSAKVSKHKPNDMGICRCEQCRLATKARKEAYLMKALRKRRNWKSNKPQQKGIYIA